MKIEKWFQILLYFCIFRFSLASLTFIVENNADRMWSFPEGSNITLVCTYKPYRGMHRFVFNSTIVSACTGTLCLTLDNEQGEFSFKHDTHSGNFTWIINTVNMKFNNKPFACIDVDEHIEYVATVEVKGYPKVNVTYQDDVKIVIVVAGVVGLFAPLLFVVAAAFFCIQTRYRLKRQKLFCSTELPQNCDDNKVSDEEEENILSNNFKMINDSLRSEAYNTQILMKRKLCD